MPSQLSEQTKPKATQFRVTAKEGLRIDQLALVLVLFLHLPLAAYNLWRFLNLPQYQYWPFVLGVFVWLVIKRHVRRELPVVRPLRRNFAAVLLCMSAGLFGVASLLYSPWLVCTSLVVCVGVGMLLLSETHQLDYAFGAWLLLCLVLIPGSGLDAGLSQWLQLTATRVSSHVLDTFGVVHVAEGITLGISSRQLFVDEACSGIISMLAIAACCAIVAVWKKRPPLHAVLLAASGIAWAAMLNICRIVTVTVVLDKLSVDLTTEIPHALLGLVLFVGTLYMTVCTDSFLLWLLGPIAEPISGLVAESDEESGFSFTRIWNVMTGPHASAEPATEEAADTVRSSPTVTGRKPSWAIVAVSLLFLPAGVLQARHFIDRVQNPRGPELRRMESTNAAAMKSIERLKLEDMPATFEVGVRERFEFQRRSKLILLGTQSNVWTYTGEHGKTNFSVDYPLDGWHELSRCYTQIGWSLVSRQVHRVGEAETPIVECEYTRKSGERGLLFFSMIDANAEPITPVEDAVWDRWQRRLSRDWKDIPGGGVYQIQAWAPRNETLSPKDRRQLRTDFLSFLGRISEQMLVVDIRND